MKRAVSFILFILLFPSAWAEGITAVETPDVQQDIVYVSPEASEVYIVWGINNWSLPESSSRPEGSFVKDKLLYTPMHKKGNSFSVSLKVKQNTMVDYVFWITSGPVSKPVDVWDVNVL